MNKSRRTSRWAMVGLAAGMTLGLAQGPSAVAQEPATVVQTSAQARLMARRAAQEDAARNLLETINGIQLQSKTTVRNFMTEEDAIRSRVMGYLRGAQVISTDYEPDGTCHVVMEVKVAGLQRALGQRCAYPSDVIRADGYGVPNPVAEPTPPPPPPPDVADNDWQTLVITATGKAVAPPDKAGTAQGNALAERGAYVDALRNLGENVKGVTIRSETKVKNFVTGSDEVQTQFDDFIRGAHKTETRQLEDGTVEVDVELPLSGLAPMVRARQHMPPPPPPGRPGMNGAMNNAPATQPTPQQARPGVEENLAPSPVAPGERDIPPAQPN